MSHNQTHLLIKKGMKKQKEMCMWHGRVKLLLGIWLIISGFLSPLQIPLNMVVVGFIGALCCFNSYRIWQAAATGIVGLWLFLSGLHDWVQFEPRILVTPQNFYISGFIMGILGAWCIFAHSCDVNKEIELTKKLYT